MFFFCDVVANSGQEVFVYALVSGRVDTANLLCAPTLSVTIVRLCGVLVDAFFSWVFSVSFYCLNGKCGELHNLVCGKTIRDLEKQSGSFGAAPSSATSSVDAWVSVNEPVTSHVASCGYFPRLTTHRLQEQGISPKQGSVLCLKIVCWLYGILQKAELTYREVPPLQPPPMLNTPQQGMLR